MTIFTERIASLLHDFGFAMNHAIGQEEHRVESVENPVHEKFPKIPRLNRLMVITEKIDGTNGQISISETGEIRVGSRNRWLTPVDDNYGFAMWVAANKSELRDCLGPGRHYGEWWGQGIQRGYELDHRRFSLFNVRRWRHAINASWYGHPWITGYKKCQRAPACCHVARILYIGPFDTETIQTGLAQLKREGSFVAPGFMRPEGIVVYHTAGNNLFKVTIENDHEGER